MRLILALGLLLASVSVAEAGLFRKRCRSSGGCTPTYAPQQFHYQQSVGGCVNGKCPLK